MRAAARTALIAGALVVTAGAASAAAIGFGGGAAAPSAPTVALDTAPVTKQTLVDSGTVQGQLDHGTSTTLQLSGADGTVTWLPAAGGTVSRGKAVVRIDEHPVPLLYGALPLYRPLAPGIEGTDVKQLERNLDALGYDGFTVDEQYTSSTAAAVRDWQEDLGLAETGTIQPGQVVYAPGAIRIDSLTAQVGGRTTGALLSYTSSAKVVTVDAAADDMAWARRGAAVTVTLPDSSTVRGAISAVGTTATESEQQQNQNNNEGPTVAVTISISDQRALRAYDRAPVEVQYSAGSRADVLTVPVTALLALAEGGYGVEIVDGGSRRTVAVETGLFADGRVEVSGPDLAEGVLVGVPK